MTNRPNGRVRGILNEVVQHRDPDFRERRPGVIIDSRHVVTVEYNDYNGHGPYTVDYNIHDMERAFPSECAATVNGHTCGAARDFRGQCYHADRHDKEEGAKS